MKVANSTMPDCTTVTGGAERTCGSEARRQEAGPSIILRVASPPITFFLLGAAKSGTTSLHGYLNEHPRISMAWVKETNFFVDRNRRVNTREALDAQFGGTAEIVHRGDSSHLHLSSPECAARIRRECPDARFLLLLRDPVERAHSLYLWNRRSGSELSGTFERALALEPTRSASERFKRRCLDHPDMYRYVESGRYHTQLERYFELFPVDRFHIRTFEEFVADPERELLQIHRFLGLEPTPLTAYPNHLPNLGIPPLAPIAHRISNSYNRGSAWRVRLAHELRRPQKKVPPLKPETRERLRQELTPSVRNLSSLLGRPAMWWLGGIEDRQQT